MASDATARHRTRPAIITLVVLLSFTSPARADETPLIVAGPLRIPDADPDTSRRTRVSVGPEVITVSQIGWTSGVAFDAPREGALRWQTTAAMTPVRAHLAHGVFASNGDELTGLEFDDTALRVTTGAVWDGPHVHVLLHAVGGGKEWLSSASPPRSPRPSMRRLAEAKRSSCWTRCEGKTRSLRASTALRGTVRGEGLCRKTRAWADASVAVSTGRQVGLFCARRRRSVLRDLRQSRDELSSSAVHGTSSVPSLSTVIPWAPFGCPREQPAPPAGHASDRSDRDRGAASALVGTPVVS